MTVRNLVLKAYKGYIRISLNTKESLDTLIRTAVATGHWRTRKNEIFSGKRYYVLNLYLYNILDDLNIVTIKTETKLTVRELKGIIDKAITDYVEPDETLNYLKSYLTVSA